ncbi:MAG: Na/Pi cotransporter family protein [Kiritimatiellae bacterium]|nr:Na/Pi cotransporter family protein [Kiritimatiellia bacterium]
MTAREIVFLVFTVLGGLALFIFGMNIMTEGLRHAAGKRLRKILYGTTRSRVAGILLGTVLGFLVHSSATTVMLVGFINAGLMTLAQSVPPMLGANIGTTLSMQMISFKLGDYCFFAITLGFILWMAGPTPQAKSMGRALLGFGLLFLGMNVMSDAIKPHRDTLAPLLARTDGSTLKGMLFGVFVATAVTGIIQSSGATIGMCFALIQAGVFTELAQVYPLVLGAHIGTCATALLGSIGTNIEARRSAASHLLFNVLNVIFAVLASPILLRLIPLTARDLTHQTANLHTAVMTVAALIVLPLAPFYARLVTLLVPSRKPPPQPSYLDESCLDRPEQAICAAIRELQRVARICAHSLRLNADLFFEYDRGKIQEIKLNEQVIDEIKLATRDYLSAMTNRYLSRRQSILIQHLDRCMIDIERIGDHIDSICDLHVRRNRVPEALFDQDSFKALFELYKSASHVLHLVIESLNPENTDFQGMARKILQARDAYAAVSLETKSRFHTKLANREMQPFAGIFYSEYIAALDRIVKHSKTIALAESQPQFWIKRKKLDRVAGEAPPHEIPQLVDPHDYLDKLQAEDYL